MPLAMKEQCLLAVRGDAIWAGCCQPQHTWDFPAGGNGVTDGPWISVTSYPPCGEDIAPAMSRRMAAINPHVCYSNANHGSKLWLATAVQLLGK